MLRFLISIILLSYGFFKPTETQANDKFGSISDEEWAITKCEFEPEASALYLLSKGEFNITYGKSYSFEVHEKIKILDQQGLKYAQLNILLSKQNDEDISSFRGIVHKRGRNGETVSIKVSKKDLTKVDINDKYLEERIAFPDVAIGDIIEYRYTMLTSSFVFPQVWDFQREIPVLLSSLNLLIERGLTYNYFINGSRIEKLIQGTRAGNTFSLRDVPSYQKNEFVYSARRYQDQLRLQLDSYYNYKTGAYSQGGTEEVVSDWNSIVKNQYFQSVMNPYLNAGDKIDILLNQSENIKADSIYTFVAETFSWNGKYRITPDQTVKSFEKSRTGNSAEINLYLCGLLRKNGIEAHPVWTATRSYGIPIQQFPLITQFNHLITIVRIGGEYKFISAINKYHPAGLLSAEENNEIGFLFHPKDYRWVNIPEAKPAMEVINLTGKILEEKVKISAEVKLTDLSAMALRQGNENRRDKFPTSGLKDLAPEHLTPLTWDNPNEVIYTTDFEVEKADKLIYIPAIPFKIIDKNPFVEEERIIPLEIPYPIKRLVNFKMEISEGYKLIEIPETVGVALPNKKGKFIYNFSVFDNTINIFCQVDIDTQKITPEEYVYYKAFIDKIVEKQNALFVLEAEN